MFVNQEKTRFQRTNSDLRVASGRGVRKEQGEQGTDRSPASEIRTKQLQ